MTAEKIIEQFTPKFQVEDIVYLKTDPEQLPRIITGILMRKNGLEYEVTCGADSAVFCYDFELSNEKNLKIS